jgi:hypothetical protein
VRATGGSQPLQADGLDAGDCLEIRFVPVSRGQRRCDFADAERVQPVALGGEILSLCRYAFRTSSSFIPLR